jgi:hypothetical protein
MPDTVVGLFRARADADHALGKLKEAGFSRDQMAVTTPQFRRRGRYGVKVLVGIVTGILWIMREAGAMEAAPIEAPLERPRPESG